MNLEMKSFTWELLSYDENGFNLQINFEYPEYISFGGMDTLKITFYNTYLYLAPKDETLGSIPDQYEIVIKLPP